MFIEGQVIIYSSLTKMGDTGLEQITMSPSKTPISQTPSANSGALHDDFVQKYPDFRNIIGRSNLSIQFKNDLIAMLMQGGDL